MSSTRAHDGWRPAMGLVVVSVLAGLAAPPPIAGPALAVAGAPASKPARVGVTLDGQTAFAVPAGELGLASGPISVAAWVRLKDTKAPQAFVNCGDANTMFTLYAYNDAVRMLVGSGSERLHPRRCRPAGRGRMGPLCRHLRRQADLHLPRRQARRRGQAGHHDAAQGQGVHRGHRRA